MEAVWSISPTACALAMVDVQMIIKASTVANTSHDEQIRFGLSCGIKPSCCCGGAGPVSHEANDWPRANVR
jgi:hypothetical protein